MSGLARPVVWVGAQGPTVGLACVLTGAVLLAGAAAAWPQPGPVGLLAPLAVAAGLAFGATGAACLLRPQGRLAAASQRLLEDAARHHAAGGLSPEGFQATRERLHAHAPRAVPQVALALSLFGASLAVLAFLLAGSLPALWGATGQGTPLASRGVLGATGAWLAAALAGALLVLRQAARWRARARSAASALQQMLADLESDILDEVRRSAQVHPEADPASKA